MSKVRRLTDTDRAEIIQLALTGERKRVIARQVRRHEDTVGDVIRDARKQGVEFPKKHNDDFWTDKRVETLRKMFAAGEAYSAIGDRLGCTKNAAISKAMRIGLDSRRQVARTVKRSTRPSSRGRKNGSDGGLGFKIKHGNFGRPKVQRTAIKPRRIEDIPNPISLAISLVDLGSRTCRYPDGEFKDPAETFCGNRVFDGEVYCEFHCRLSYTPPARRNIENMARVV